MLDFSDRDCEVSFRKKHWILGLSYYDAATDKSVLITETTNSVGELHGSNVVIYPDAFTDFRASIRLTYTRAGFEQDIILLEQPPSCTEWGMNPETTVLQVLTEFFDPPQPGKRLGVSTDGKGRSKADEILDFPGNMQMGFGRAFSLDADSSGEDIPVSKQWLKLDRRDFLVEEVEVSAVEKHLEMLPRGAALPVGTNVMRQARLGKPLIPARRQAQASNKQMRMAKATLPNKGFVLDYVTLNTSQTNYLFKGDTTYYFSGNVILYGTNTTFEGAAVLKYTNGVTLTVNSPVSWLADSYRPVVMVARDDDSVGETISGSTGNPSTNFYAATALYFNAATANTNLSLRNVRIANATRAIAINTKSGHVLSHVQMLNCAYGLTLTNAEVSLRNALMYLVRTNFTGSSSTGRVEHLTSHRTTRINGNIGSNLFITNSLFVLITNATSFTSVNNRTNSAASGIFTNVGGGFHYLVSGSTNRNVGTTNINANLLADLRKLTTYPPLVVTNLTFSASTNWSDRAQRDTSTNDLPDVGYHYVPLDFAVSGIAITNGTFTLTNGVAISHFGSNPGISASGNGRLASMGSAAALNWVAGYETIQEQGYAPWSNHVGVAAIYDFYSASAGSEFRFAGWSTLQVGRFHFEGGGTSRPVVFDNCQFYNGDLYWGDYLLSVTNSLIQDVYIELTAQFGGSAHFYNNLLRRSSLQFAFDSDWPAVASDNLFDSTSIEQSTEFGFSSHGYNAYYESPRLAPEQGSDVVLTNQPDYVSGPLGHYYYPTTGSSLSLLLNAGNTNANYLGLYHYTTTANRVKETNSIVDIGFHYVASSATGQLSDFDGDGIPDYIEDANGNGVVDAGESEWRVVITNQPQSQVVVAGNGAMFTVGASGQPLYYQWLFNGTNAIAGATSSSYSIPVVSPTNAGVYSVIVSNQFGGVFSSNAVLTVTCSAVPSGLIGYWEAENNALDSASNHHGNLLSGTYATGVAGTAFQFDGTNSYVQIADAADLKPTNITIEAWVKFDSLTSMVFGGAQAGWQFIVFKQNTRTASFEGYCLAKWTDNTIFFGVSSADGDYEEATDSTPVQTNVWYHIVGVRGSNYVELYVNGQLKQHTTVGFPQDYGTKPVYFGSSGDSSFDGKLKGKLDEVSIFNRSLSSNEVVSLYLAGPLGRCPRPLSISLVNPLDGDTFITPIQPTLSARVTGQATAATNVAFFVNGVKLGDTASGTNGYYSLIWANPPTGTNSLTAVVTDNQGVNVTSSVVNVTINSGTFVKGINLNGDAVTIEGNLWLSYQAATNAGLSVSSNVTALVRTNVSLLPPGDTNAQHMLQTMLARQRLPATNVLTQFVYSKPAGEGTYNRLVTLTNVAPGYVITNVQYQAWCVEYGTADPAGTYQASLYYSYGAPDPRFPYRSYNQVNYILNNKGSASLKDIQFAIWTVLGTDPSVFGAPDNLATYQQLTNNANLYGTDFVPGPTQIVGVILEATNAAMAQPLLIEIQGSNKPISFTLSQTLTNGDYSLYLWLAENEASHLRSLDLKVQSSTVATNAGDLELGQWRKLGPYAASVTNGVMTLEIISLVKGDPLLMGLAVYTTNSVVTNQPPTISWVSPTDNQLFIASPTNILLWATNSGGPITSMEYYYYGTNHLGGSSAAPYQILWTNVTAGTYTLRATGTNSNTGTAVSSDITITVASIPQVQIINPTNGAVYLAGASLTVTGQVVNTVGLITNVDFYINYIKVGNDIAQPYTYAWNSIPAGNYSLHAIAHSDLGAVGQSPVISVVIDGPPSLTILTPENDAQPSARANIRLTSIAEDDGIITNVAYFLYGTNLIGSTTISPYAVTLINLSAGTYWFKAVASDNRGQTAFAYVTNDVIKQLPSVEIILPHTNDVFAYAQPIPIQARATDPDGTVTNVVFRVGATPIGTNSIGVSNIFNFLWTNAPAVASTNLFAVATDNDGQSRTSAPVSITVVGCITPGVSNLILSTNQVIGGMTVYGTVILSNTATTGGQGQAVALYSSSSNALTPRSVFIPQGELSSTFIITTTAVIVTNTLTISASYHGETEKNALLSIIPNNYGGTNVTSAIRPEFMENILEPSCDDCSYGPTNIGFELSYYCKRYTNLWINMNHERKPNF